MRIKKIFATGIFPIAIILFTTYLYLVHKNNIDTPTPSSQEVQIALNKAINWVLTNQKELIRINNPALWWFLDESAKLTHNRKLSDLVKKYRNTVLEKNSIWSGYWIKSPSIFYYPGALDYMEEYQQFFVYSLTCEIELGEEQVIQKQFNSNFCDWSPFYSSCTTHQLMAIRLLQIKDCGNQQENQTLSDKLVEKIHKQITWDPRVGDVYIQRAMMLIESGNYDKVKSVWIKKILYEQRENGGWVNFYRFFNITDTIEFGYGYKLPEIRAPAVENFHTTSQAIYLLSLLMKENN